MITNEQLILNNLAKNIKSKRQELKLSQEQLASKCGFDRTYISLLERGKRNPSIINLKKLCDGLETELSNLLQNI